MKHYTPNPHRTVGFHAFMADFLACALWTMPGEDGNENPGDAFTIFDFDQQSLDKLAGQCRRFYDTYESTWDRGGWTDGQAGHDFALTRNRHGAGFWDRRFNDDSGAVGDMLTRASHQVGEFNLYVGDDGKIHCS